MSGVDVSDKQENSQIHACESCMNAVVQTLSHLQAQIAQLNLAKTKLQMELENTKKDKKEQRRNMRKEIRLLEAKLSVLKKPSIFEK